MSEYRAPTSAVNYKSANTESMPNAQRWQIVEIAEDVSSGAKASRPALNRLIADAEARKIDCLLVWKLDLFGRSLVDCLSNIREEQHPIHRGHQGLDTDLQDPASRFFCCMSWVPPPSSNGR